MVLGTAQYKSYGRLGILSVLILYYLLIFLDSRFLALASHPSLPFPVSRAMHSNDILNILFSILVMLEGISLPCGWKQNPKFCFVSSLRTAYLAVLYSLTSLLDYAIILYVGHRVMLPLFSSFLMSSLFPPPFPLSFFVALGPSPGSWRGPTSLAP